MAETILATIAQLRQAFIACFENQVSSSIVNELPVDFKTIRYIKNLLSLNRLDNQSYIIIETGLSELEHFIKIVQVYFLPRAKELMRVSPLKPDQMVSAREVFVLRRLALTALPLNLRRVEELARELRLIIALAA